MLWPIISCLLLLPAWNVKVTVRAPTTILDSMKARIAEEEEEAWVSHDKNIVELSLTCLTLDLFCMRKMFVFHYC
jgi:hypothetical protein